MLCPLVAAAGAAPRDCIFEITFEHRAFIFDAKQAEPSMGLEGRRWRSVLAKIVLDGRHSYSECGTGAN